MPPRRFRASESSSEKDAKENSKKENKGKDRKKDTSEKGAKEKPKKEDTEKDGKSDTKKKPKNVEPDTEGPGKCGTKKDDDTDESGGGLDSDEANPGAMKKPSARQAGQEKCFALLASFFCAQPLTHMLFFRNAGRAKKDQLQRNRIAQKRRRAIFCLRHALQDSNLLALYVKSMFHF